MVTIQERRNQCSRLLKDGMRINLWDPRFNVHNEWKHEVAKCKLLYELKKEGKHAIGEAIFKNGARADIQKQKKKPYVKRIITQQNLIFNTKIVRMFYMKITKFVKKYTKFVKILKIFIAISMIYVTIRVALW